jgi:hypothetical protein
MIQVLANSLVPIFVGLIFGYAAGLFKVVDNKDVKSLVSFLMTFALPSSLFVVIALTPRPLLWEQAGAAVVIAIVFLGCLCCDLLCVAEARQRNCRKQCCPGADAWISESRRNRYSSSAGCLWPQGLRQRCRRPRSRCDYDHPYHACDSRKRNQCGRGTVYCGAHSHVSGESSSEARILGARARCYCFRHQVSHANLC